MSYQHTQETPAEMTGACAHCGATIKAGEMARRELKDTGGDSLKVAWMCLDAEACQARGAQPSEIDQLKTERDELEGRHRLARHEIAELTHQLGKIRAQEKGHAWPMMMLGGEPNPEAIAQQVVRALEARLEQAEQERDALKAHAQAQIDALADIYGNVENHARIKELETELNEAQQDVARLNAYFEDADLQRSALERRARARLVREIEFVRAVERRANDIPNDSNPTRRAVSLARLAAAQLEAIEQDHAPEHPAQARVRELEAERDAYAGHIAHMIDWLGGQIEWLDDQEWSCEACENFTAMRDTLVEWIR